MTDNHLKTNILLVQPKLASELKALADKIGCCSWATFANAIEGSLILLQSGQPQWARLLKRYTQQSAQENITQLQDIAMGSFALDREGRDWRAAGKSKVDFRRSLTEAREIGKLIDNLGGFGEDMSRRPTMPDDILKKLVIGFAQQFFERCANMRSNEFFVPPLSTLTTLALEDSRHSELPISQSDKIRCHILHVEHYLFNASLDVRDGRRVEKVPKGPDGVKIWLTNICNRAANTLG